MNASNTRPIPPMPGGGSWTFDKEAWDWVANEPVSAQAPADAGNEQAANAATDKE